jgi:DUF1680 family protein
MEKYDGEEDVHHCESFSDDRTVDFVLRMSFWESQGGIGAVGTWEGFGPNYYLPNNTAYSETCASISLIFFAQQMSLNFPFETKYSDVLELALYNAS